MAHDAPLRLRTGPDRLLTWLPMACALAATVLMLARPFAPDISLPACAFSLICAALLIRRSAADLAAELELQREGAARWRVDGADWQHGRWSQHAWINRRYAVVAVRHGGSKRRFIVTRAHQAPERFRILSAWLRWPRTAED